MLRGNCRIVILLLILLWSQKSFAQQPAVALDKALSEKHLFFSAQSAMPMRGASRNLTPGYYYLRINGDSLISYLPYFGDQYSVPAPEELIYGGYQFITRAFSYQLIRRKNRREITITAKPYKDPLTISISISPNGWGQIYVQSAGRDPISYYGKLSPL